MGRVVHFDVVVRDVTRASAFYREVFGWHLEKWEGPMEYWLIATGDENTPGINGGLGIGEPNITHVVVTVEVADVAATLEATHQHGGSVTQERSPIPGVGHYAEITDTEGNHFGVMQPDANAS